MRWTTSVVRPEENSFRTPQIVHKPLTYHPPNVRLSTTLEYYTKTSMRTLVYNQQVDEAICNEIGHDYSCGPTWATKRWHVNRACLSCGFYFVCWLGSKKLLNHVRSGIAIQCAKRTYACPRRGTVLQESPEAEIKRPSQFMLGLIVIGCFCPRSSYS